MERAGFLDGRGRAGDRLGNDAQPAHGASWTEEIGALAGDQNQPEVARSSWRELLFDKAGPAAPRKTHARLLRYQRARCSNRSQGEYPICRADSGIPQSIRSSTVTYVGRAARTARRKRPRALRRFDQVATATGRISSAGAESAEHSRAHGAGPRDPRARLSRRPGCVLVDADYSQIELRVLGAHVRRRDDARRAFLRGTGHPPPHRRGGVRRAACRGDARDALRGRRPSISASSTAFPISRWRRTSPSPAKRRASSSSAYFARYPGVKKYMDEAVAGRKARATSTRCMGRRRYLPELASGNSATCAPSASAAR